MGILNGPSFADGGCRVDEGSKVRKSHREF
jgi:hypothetical protein